MSSFDFQKLYHFKCLEVDELNQRLSLLEEEIARLKELLKLQQDRLFGKKSEVSPNLGAPDENKNDNNTSEKLIKVNAHNRKKRGPRTVDTSQLPKHTLIHDLSEEQKICACGCQLHLIGQEVSEKVEIIPARYCVIESIRMKYGCRACNKIKMSPKPDSPLPKAIAGPSLLTDVIVSKYHYHLPLYRQSKIMASYNLDISDKTLSNWVVSSGNILLKMYYALWVILKNRYLQVDETPVKILEPNKKGYVWTYLAPNTGFGKGLVVFEFSETRSSTIVNERLKDFSGLLQTDGYSGYAALRKRKGIIGFGCFSHARRKFSEVIKISGDKDGIAAEMIERMKPLYKLEDILKKIQAPHRIRKKLRQKKSRPITKAIYKWLRAIQPTVLPKSKLGQAIAYTLNQWPYLIKYLQYGMAEIDTNYVENKIRPIALGKKNWLFIGNEKSGLIHTLFYSLILSALMNKINPRVYIHYLLTQANDLRLGKVDPITLLPDRIDSEKLQKFATEQIEYGRKILDSS